MNKQYTFKIIIVGDSFTGKTTIFKKFCDQEIENGNVKPTIGVDFKVKELVIREKHIKLQLWDTAGQERFRPIISSFYKGNDCVIFCYDITNKESFDNIDHWIYESNKFNSHRKIVKILIGNKIDDEENRKVSYEEGLKISNENNMEFFEISAINNKELDAIISTIAGLILTIKEEENEKKEKPVKERVTEPIVLNNKWNVNTIKNHCMY